MKRGEDSVRFGRLPTGCERKPYLPWRNWRKVRPKRSELLHPGRVAEPAPPLRPSRSSRPRSGRSSSWVWARTCRRTAASPNLSGMAALSYAALVDSAPDLGGGLDDEGELGHLLVVAQRVSLHRGREAALRGQAELVQRHVLGRLVDAALQGVLGLQLAAFRGDQAEHDVLARRHEPQRGEAAGAGVVVFEEEPVHGELAEQRLGHEVVAALGRPGGAEV